LAVGAEDSTTEYQRTGIEKYLNKSEMTYKTVLRMSPYNLRKTVEDLFCALLGASVNK